MLDSLLLASVNHRCLRRLGPSHVSGGSKSVIVIKMDHSCDSQKAVPVLAEGRDSQKDVTVKRP